MPSEGKLRRTFYLCWCLCCFESSPLLITARVPIAGYVPGEKIKVMFTADNQSNLSVLNLKAQFIKVI